MTPIARNIILIVSAAILVVTAFLGVRFILTQQKGNAAGLKVTSIPTASVFLDSRNIGRTPYEDKIEPGEYTLKLIPEITSGETVSWQGRVKLSANLLTYVNRELGKSELTSGGEILTLEKIKDRASEIAVMSTPEGASVKLDGIERGTSPLSLKKIEPGDHELSISAPGFTGRSIKIRTTAGYKLLADIQLALGKEPVASSSPTPQPQGTTKEDKTTKTKAPSPSNGTTVKILDTPTGWLRVRGEPSTSASESAKVNPGETYSVLEEQSGWYKIEFEKGKIGWISSRYTEKTQ